MTKEVMIAIKGLQFYEQLEEGELETIQKGEYYKKNNSHYILFEEETEGFSKTTKSMIKVTDNEVVLTKKGLMNVTMNFVEGKKHFTNYGTSFGNLVIGVEGKKIEVSEEEEKLALKIEYRLDMNYEHLADCKIDIAVQSFDCWSKK